MTRVAVLNDIHGNLVALDAVLEELHREQVARIVVGGDVVPGPLPSKVLERLRGQPTPVDFIYGNGEVAVLEVASGKVPSKVPEPYRPMITWSAEQLDAPQLEFMRRWPATLRFELPQLGRVLICHATPRNENEIFTRLTAEERLVPVFAGSAADVVVCGHTHMQFDRMVGATRVINAGSVGWPFGHTGAAWLLLGAEVELRRTPYDVERAAEQIRASGYPDATTLANAVLTPPPEADMLKRFSAAELVP